MGKYVDGVYYDYTPEEKKQAEKELRKLRVVYQNLPMTTEEILYEMACDKVRNGNYDGEAAYKRIDFYPNWDELVNTTLDKDLIFRVDKNLFRARAGQYMNPAWKPEGNGANVASVFPRVIDPSVGTLEKPILYNGNIEIEVGKYYMEELELYKGIRNSGIPVHDTLEKLSTDQGGKFVEVVD